MFSFDLCLFALCNELPLLRFAPTKGSFNTSPWFMVGGKQTILVSWIHKIYFFLTFDFISMYTCTWTYGKLAKYGKVSAQVSLHRLRRLPRFDAFHRCIKPPFTDYTAQLFLLNIGLTFLMQHSIFLNTLVIPWSQYVPKKKNIGGTFHAVYQKRGRSLKSCSTIS